MIRAARAPWVHYHNIIGVVPEEGLFNRFSQGSDGVVELESAHMDDVDSEIIVESSHQDIHRKPRAILEVRRILVEHLDTLQYGTPSQPPTMLTDRSLPPIIQR